jgi:hypothetical protein
VQYYVAAVAGQTHTDLASDAPTGTGDECPFAANIGFLHDAVFLFKTINPLTGKRFPINA